jgi:formylglycine-generating enzyme
MTTMKIRSHVIRMGLCALALWTGAARPVAADQIKDTALVPRLTIAATVGTSNQILYRTNLSQAAWVVLTNLVVAETNYWFVDVGAPPGPSRFYRVAFSTNNPTPPGMVLIPAGSFMMGDCMNDGSQWDLPVHEVYVSAFYMDRYEVSLALWNEVKQWSDGNGYSYERVGTGKAANHPVVGPNWRDSVKWCNARSQREGLTPCYYNEEECTTVYKTGTGTPYPKWEANGYRLPTEAEWEKAARGGASGHRFPWTDTDNISHSRANYKADQYYDYDESYPVGFNPTFATGSMPYTSPVSSFAPNGYGLYGLAGNAWEWCWDWMSSHYSSEPQTDPHGGPDIWAGYRVMRGGAWDDYVIYCRAAKRGCCPVEFSYPDQNLSVGFRSVRPSGQ